MTKPAIKFPIRIDDNPAHDWGWMFLDAEGEQVSPDDVMNALNDAQEFIEKALKAHPNLDLDIKNLGG